MIAAVQHDPRTQRRGRIVIVAMIVMFLAVCAALGWFLVQRAEQEALLADLTQTGLQRVGVPELPQTIEGVAALPDHRGVVATYVDGDGTPVPQLRLLNLRAGASPDLCQILGSVEPDLAQGCAASGDEVSASASGPSAFLVAEGTLHESTLVVLVSHPASYTGAELRLRVDAAEVISLRDLLGQVG